MNYRIFAALGLAIACAAPTVADTSDSGEIPEIVVTAQRREQNLQDVGIAISVVSGAELRAKGITSSTEIADLTPGVHMSGSLAGQSQQFSIRGVTQNDFNDSIEAPVAVYIDDAYIPNQQGQTASLFDISRVEILKGPQGTLFGRNATGGLVQFVVNEPSQTPEGNADVTFARFGEEKAVAMLNGPLNDWVAARGSFFYDRIENFWNNVFPDGAAADLPTIYGPPLSGCCSDEGGSKTYAGRLQLLLTPTSDLKIRLVGQASKQTLSTAPYSSVATTAVVNAAGSVVNSVLTGSNDTRTIIGPGGANYFNPSIFPLQGAQTALGYGPGPGLRFPGATWFGYTPVSAKDLELSSQYAQGNANHVSSESGTIHVNDSFAGIDLASITNYLKFEKMLLLDAVGAPEDINQFGTESRGQSISQELRLSGSTQALHWVTGLYYLHINTHGDDGLLGATGSLFAGSFGASATGIDPIADRTLRTNSTSVFGQLEFEFAPKWTVVAGARGIDEQQHYNLSYFAFKNDNDYAVDVTTPLFPLPYAPFENSRIQHLWAGKFQFEFRPVDGLLTFLGINRGVKAGSYNAKDYDGSPDIAPGQIPYKPEVLVSTEGGVKWLDPGHRYSIGVSVYHYDYKDYQAFLFTSNTGFVQNVKDRTNGIEFEGDFKVSSSFDVTAGYSYSHATIPDYEVAPGVFRDVEPAYAPRQEADVGATYHIPGIYLKGEFTANADVSYSSSFYDDLRNFDSEQLAGRTLTNASIAWSQGKTGMHVDAYIKNLADRRYPILGFDSSPNCGCSIQAYGMPRTFGLTVGGSF
jgi:iron complex outermembrane receptor protein